MKSNEALEQLAYLKEITEKSRLKASYGYPYFLLWGIVMAIGYIGVLWVKPGLFWTIADSAGILISVFIGIYNKDKPSYLKTPRLLKYIGLQSLIIIIFGLIIFSLFVKYEHWAVVVAFWPFLFGIIYLIASVHMGFDLAIIGLWIVATSAISLLFTSQVQSIWLACTDGGGLIFTGILFRYQIKKDGLKIEN